MKATTFEAAAQACAVGTISFREFVEATDARWKWWARRLARSRIPAWLDLDDIRQELLVEIWRALSRYNTTKAKQQTPAKFAEFAAKKHAQKQVQRARGDDRHTWAWGPSRFDIPASSLCREGADDDEGDFIYNIPVEADQFRARERREAVMQLARSQGSLRDFFAVQALAAAEGDVAHAAQILWDDLDARLLCRFPNDVAARNVLLRLAVRLAAAA